MQVKVHVKYQILDRISARDILPHMYSNQDMHLKYWRGLVQGIFYLRFFQIKTCMVPRPTQMICKRLINEHSGLAGLLEHFHKSYSLSFTPLHDVCVAFTYTYKVWSAQVFFLLYHTLPRLPIQYNTQTLHFMLYVCLQFHIRHKQSCQNSSSNPSRFESELNEDKYLRTIIDIG